MFKLPQGENWYELSSRKGTVAYGKKQPTKDHIFFTSPTITNFTTRFNSPEEFLKFAKQSRLESIPKDRFKILKYEEKLEKSRSEFCTKFMLKAEEYGKGIMESRGYTCLHPHYPDLGVTILYSERTKGPHVNDQTRQEGEDFINSFELR